MRCVSFFILNGAARNSALALHWSHKSPPLERALGLDPGKEWLTKSALQPKNAPSPAGHFGRRADLATGRAPVPSP
jgi:hypothetical protein